MGLDESQTLGGLPDFDTGDKQDRPGEQILTSQLLLNGHFLIVVLE